MKVVHFSCVAPPEIGGIGSVALREVTGLRARGVDARLVTSESIVPLANDDERSFVEREKPLWRFGNALILPSLKKWRTRADVIHLHYPFYGTGEFLLWNRRELPPVVVTFHMDATAQGWKGALFGLHRKFIQPRLFDHAAKILVSSFDYAHRSSLASWFKHHTDKVQELAFGVDTEFFSPGPSARMRLSLPTDVPVVLAVGGLDRAHAFKGIPILLKAFQHLDVQAHLLIVGDGDLKKEYEEQARLLGISARTHFVGRVDLATLRDAYRSADVLAFPSVNSAEAFGLVLLEAQACGIPVIASDLPGVRTLVQHGESGMLVPPSDVDALSSALASMIVDLSRSRSMGVHAREIAKERFSWDRHLDGLEEVYRNVCASRS